MSAKRGLPPRKRPKLDEDGMPLEPVTPNAAVDPAPVKLIEPNPSGASRIEANRTKPKERFTVTLPPDLIERLRDASFETRETMAGLVEEGIALVLARVAADLGGEVPKRPVGGQLRKGRPMKDRG